MGPAVPFEKDKVSVHVLLDLFHRGAVVEGLQTRMAKELPLEWMYRIVRTATVSGGTSEIHRGMIAGELVGRRFDQRLPRA